MLGITPEQRMPWDEWERTFGSLRWAGKTGTLRHKSGRVFKVRLDFYRRDGDDCVFQLEIIDEAQGSA